jgi:hypothetical protein
MKPIHGKIFFDACIARMRSSNANFNIIRAIKNDLFITAPDINATTLYVLRIALKPA